MGGLRAPGQQAPVIHWLPVLTAQHAPSPLQRGRSAEDFYKETYFLKHIDPAWFLLL